MGKISNAFKKAGLEGSGAVHNVNRFSGKIAPKKPYQYMMAANVITKGPTLLVLLSDLDLPNQTTDAKFFKYYSLLTKMQLMGNNEIKQTLSAFLQELIATYLMLLFQRCRLLIRQGNIDLLSKFIRTSKSREEFHLRSFYRLTTTSHTEGKSRKSILNDLKHEMTQQKTYFDEQQQLISIQNKELFHYTKLCIIKARELSQRLPIGFTRLSGNG